LCKFLAIFCHYFASNPASVSTPNFQKSTPFENLALTFFSLPLPFSHQNRYKRLYSSHLAKSLKIRLFSPKKFLARNFQKFEGVECSFSEQNQQIFRNNLGDISANKHSTFFQSKQIEKTLTFLADRHENNVFQQKDGKKCRFVRFLPYLCNKIKRHRL